METIIRSPDCSLGPVPDTQNSSLGLVPVSIIDVWDWSQREIFKRHFLYLGPDRLGIELGDYLVPDIQNSSCFISDFR